jgi:hypothetical protein
MVERIEPNDAHRKAVSQQAVLVCAYDDEEKCNRLRLDGAISLKQLQSRETAVDKNTELIFYCA